MRLDNAVTIFDLRFGQNSRIQRNAVSTGKSVGTAFFLGEKARAVKTDTIYRNINR